MLHNLFTNKPQELTKNPQVRAIKKCITSKGTTFDKLRQLMVKELLK